MGILHWRRDGNDVRLPRRGGRVEGNFGAGRVLVVDPGFMSTFTRGFIPVVLRTPVADGAQVLEPLGRL
jgi:hypothetical protein